MKDSRTITIVSIVLSVLLALLVVLGLRLGYGQTKEVYDVVIFGDSNMGNFRGPTGPSRVFAKESKLRVLNAAVGGTMMNNKPTESCIENPWRYFSMVDLSKAVLKKDFLTQKAERPQYYVDFYDGNFDYVEASLNELSKADFSKVKYIFICQGLNDYLNGARIYDPEDKYNEETFTGALRVSVENLKKAAPEAEIIVMAPNYNTVLGDSDIYSTGHGSLPDYIEQEMLVCEEYGLKFTSLNGPINKDNSAEYLYDGMHINDDGARLIADIMLEAINLK